jgi:hypothetical protein
MVRLNWLLFRFVSELNRGLSKLLLRHDREIGSGCVLILYTSHAIIPSLLYSVTISGISPLMKLIAVRV